MTRLEDSLWALAMGSSGLAALVLYGLRLAHRLPTGNALPALATVVCCGLIAARSWRQTALKRKTTDR